MSAGSGGRDVRRAAILAKRFPGRPPGAQTDDRSYAQLIRDAGPIRPAGSRSPADQVRALHAERLAREAASDAPGAPGQPPAPVEPPDAS